MEILTLKLRLEDRDLVPVAELLGEKAEGVEKLAMRFTPEGVVVAGMYPTPFMKVSFETVWSVRALGAEVRVKLETLRVAGLPGGFLRGMLMKMAKDAIEGQAGVSVEGDEITVRVAEAAREHGLEVTANFTRVALGQGTAKVEAGPRA